jgi:hypothetical protein
MIEKVELLTSRDGYKIVNFTKDGATFSIGSRYSERREIAEFLDSIGDIKKNENYIVFGMGGLNHIRELSHNKFSKSKILVIECSQECVELITRDVDVDEDLAEILGHQDVVVASELDLVRSFLKNYINGSNVNKLKVSAYSGYTRYFKEEIQPFRELIVNHRIEVMANNATLNKFEDDWYRNSIKNLRYVNVTRTLFPYKNTCTRKPAIIVSAGPSLDKNISLLKENRDAVVISGGRTLKALLNIGVDPDFLAIIDASRLSYQLVEPYIGMTTARLVYYYSVPTEMLAMHKGEKITFHQDSAVQQFFQEEVINLMAGGSVAHAMTALAVELGCDPIIFIGQDLAYTNQMEHSHAAGSPWRNEEVSLTPELEGASFYVDDVFGKKVRTCLQLDLYRRQLERIIESNEDRTFINCTEGGVSIKGTDVFALEEVYSQLPHGRSDIFVCGGISKNLDLVGILRANRRHMVKAIDQYTKAVRICDKYINLIETDVMDFRLVHKELNSIEMKIRNNNKKILFIESMINKILASINTATQYVVLKSDTEQESLLKNLMKSRYLYESLSEKLRENVKIVEDEIMTLGEL